MALKLPASKTGKEVVHLGQPAVEVLEGIQRQRGNSCMRRPMLNDSPRDDLVYEPFAGSGVTILAAEMAERRCLAV